MFGAQDVKVSTQVWGAGDGSPEVWVEEGRVVLFLRWRGEAVLDAAEARALAQALVQAAREAEEGEA